MNTSAPIELKLYSKDDEEIGKLSRTRIPSYLLDTAINLQNDLSKDDGEKPNADALFDFIVEFFGSDKIDRETLKQQTDLVECMNVLRSILARANDLARQFAQANPPGPSPKKK